METRQAAGTSRWRKKTISCGLGFLGATFALLMFWGQVQQRGNETHEWSERPSAGYHSAASLADIRQNNTAAKGGLSHTPPVYSKDGNYLPAEGGNLASSIFDWLKDDLESQKAPVDPGGLGAEEENAETVGNRTDSGSTSDVICDKCCYRYVPIEDGITVDLSPSERKRRGCRRRLPDALIFGVKKGGTTTLKNFISYHPDIAFTHDELKFFTSPSEMSKGLEYYRKEMIYSTPRQVAMEKTPAYHAYPSVPRMIKKALPDVRLIIIMRDPVERAVSDFVHMQVTIAKYCKREANGNADGGTCTYKSGGYNIADTFDESVLDSDGAVIASSPLISKGVYVTGLLRFLKYFPPEQILAVDGEAFIHDPYPAVKSVEQFLGIREYFTKDHFYFDDQKGFFCLQRPLPSNCMKKAKGRPHPHVKDETLKKLRDYFRPHNERLSKLMNMKFQWSS